MPKVFISMLLITQLLCQPAPARPLQVTQPQATRLWWGLIDPELSTWFSRLPMEDGNEPILWDFSWQSFLAALFGQPVIKEVSPHAERA